MTTLCCTQKLLRRSRIFRPQAPSAAPEKANAAGFG